MNRRLKSYAWIALASALAASVTSCGYVAAGAAGAAAEKAYQQHKDGNGDKDSD